MDRNFLEYIQSLQDKITKTWYYETKGIYDTLVLYCGIKETKEIYRICFRSILNAFRTNKTRSLRSCARILVDKQQLLISMNSRRTTLLYLLVSLKDILRNFLRDKKDYFLRLEHIIDELALIYEGYLCKVINNQNETLTRRVRELSSLNNSSACINSTLDLQQVLEYILDEVAGLMGTNTCAIYELDHSKNLLKIVAHKGLSVAYTQNIRIPIGQGAAGKAVETMQPVELRDVQNEWYAKKPPEFIAPLLNEINFKAILAVPLICKEKAIGCIAVYYGYYYNFPKTEQSLLSIFADHAALAVENARLHKKEKELAIIKERNRIARELHDSVCQSMFSLVLNAEACKYFIDNNRDKALESIMKLQNVAQDALNELRNLIFELRPEVLREKGLIVALKSYLSNLAKVNNLYVEFTNEEVTKLTEDIELCLYRVAQEAMSNIIKHAAAKTVRVNLLSGVDSICILIIDDGKGFNVMDAMQKGNTLGLITMRERVDACGGQFMIRSVVDNGTTVEASIPLMA